MPHWDFRCVLCGTVHDWTFLSFAEMERVSASMICGRVFPREKHDPSWVVGLRCHGRVERLIAASQFEMKGFREENGYASPVTISQRRGSVKTTLTGNPEILRDMK